MLNDINIGFIGGGAMAEAILAGMLKVGLIKAEHLFVADHKIARCEELHKKYGVHTCLDAKDFSNKIKILILAIKPQVADIAMMDLQLATKAETVVVSVVAGLSIQAIEAYFKKQAVLRVMPNTPVAVGEGMSVISLGTQATEDTGQMVKKIFSAVGQALILPESTMNAVTGLSGSGPGYAFVMIDALADAGVKTGLPRKTAITLAAQTLLGAAKMVLETGVHPAELRDMVTSPGGTTIAGIHVMEQRGVRAALIDAVEASAIKSKAMGNK